MNTKSSAVHHQFNPQKYRQPLVSILKALENHSQIDKHQLNQLLRRHPKDGSGYFSKANLIKAYRQFAGKYGLKPYDPQLVASIKMKPIRTISGVTPVTVLTKPYPCPGKCIFCPSDLRMPKSYIRSEPGAQRAEKNHFDPYLQTYNRLSAFKQIGHNYQKVELIVLGGTWSFYPEAYKIWFIKRCFEALNDFGHNIDQRPSVNKTITPIDISLKPADSDRPTTYNQEVTKFIKTLIVKEESSPWEELRQQQQQNQTAAVRCIGLVLETRPDYISKKEVVTLRRLGCTKTQIGIQSLSDRVLALNQRGHTVAATKRAFRLLRLAGFKIHAHWMPNLYGSNLRKDILDYIKLFTDPNFKPDELKIYPCSLIKNTPLVDLHQKGKWTPYTKKELLSLLLACFQHTPEYCRLTRIIRDIPSPDIVAGNKLTNFRQIAEKEAIQRGCISRDIRSREIRDQSVKPKELSLKTLCYKTKTSIEYFLQYVTKTNHIAGFLRLSLPTIKPFIKELTDCAIIREVHVYGQSLHLGKSKTNAAQHMGLGKSLIAAAEDISIHNKYPRIAVISAIGTRQYYNKLGYALNELYQLKPLA